MAHNVSEIFETVLRLHQAGRLREAEECCRQLLVRDPSFADGWHILGLIALQEARNEDAVQHLGRAIQLAPEDAETFNNLGVARKNLAQWNDAIDCFTKAIEFRPDFAEARFNLANALHERGRIEEAIDEYYQVLKLQPADPVLYNCLANALRNVGRTSDAILAYRRALELQPAYAEAHYNLGTVYQLTNRDDEAIACYRRAVELNPQFAEAYSNLGTILKNHDQLNEASACFRRALELKPQDVELLYNWACILLAQNDRDAGTFVLEQVLQMQPDHAEAHYNRATLRLLAGDFDRGWTEFEWRWKTTQQQPRNFSQPIWSGEALQGRSILLHAEQGIGDTLQFIRYASLVKRLGGRVIVECPRSLVPLLATVRSIDQLCGLGDELPAFEVHAPLLSLPRIVGTTMDSIPADVPYLLANEALVGEWAGRLSRLKGFRIGINWRGRSGRGSFRQRDIPLTSFAEISAISGVHLVSLHKGAGQQDLLKEGAGIQILGLGSEIDQEHGAFMDTSAIMKNLDLVISSDTSIAHLAGALAIPVWLALPHAADWRWLLDRDDSPWYPTMRIFRQKRAGDWSGVFGEIEKCLVDYLRERQFWHGQEGAAGG